MTTVSEQGGPYGPLTLTEAITAVFDDAAAVVPKELLFPPGESSVQSKERSAADFDGAQSNAVAAALTHLGIPVTDEAFVASVLDDGPAAGDRAGRRHPERERRGRNGPQLRRRRGAAHGTRHRVADGRPPRRQGDAPDGQGRREAGSSGPGIPRDLDQELLHRPFPIDFTLEGVGGPSAGLMFTLAITDELTPAS